MSASALAMAPLVHGMNLDPLKQSKLSAATSSYK
jgi:hypothetical protein